MKLTLSGCNETAYRATDICVKCRLRQASGKIKEEFRKFRIVILGVFIIMHAQNLLGPLLQVSFTLQV